MDKPSARKENQTKKLKNCSNCKWWLSDSSMMKNFGRCSRVRQTSQIGPLLFGTIVTTQKGQDTLKLHTKEDTICLNWNS
jgi:hypothetical protein